MGNVYVGARNLLKEFKQNQRMPTDPSFLKRKVGDRYFHIFLLTATFPILLSLCVSDQEQEIKSAYLEYREEVNSKIGYQ